MTLVSARFAVDIDAKIAGNVRRLSVAHSAAPNEPVGPRLMISRGYDVDIVPDFDVFLIRQTRVIRTVARARQTLVRTVTV